MRKNKHKEREFRLKPRRPAARGERRVYTSAYKIIMHRARMSGVRRSRVVGFGAASRAIALTPSGLRCGSCIPRGHCRAHGRYVARESATQYGDPRAVGFDDKREAIDIATRREDW